MNTDGTLTIGEFRHQIAGIYYETPIYIKLGSNLSPVSYITWEKTNDNTICMVLNVEHPEPSRS